MESIKAKQATRHVFYPAPKSVYRGLTRIVCERRAITPVFGKVIGERIKGAVIRKIIGEFSEPKHMPRIGCNIYRSARCNRNRSIPIRPESFAAKNPAGLTRPRTGV